MPKASRSLGIVFFPAFDWAISPTHPEREERLLYTHDQLVEDGLFDIEGISEYKPDIATHAQIEATHFCLPTAQAVCGSSHLVSAGGAIKAAKLVMEGRAEHAFALVRPPGHHAMRVTYGNRGFCNVNIEAVMISFLRHTYGPLKIAVVDTDCHHGDGTQNIYWNDPDTLFISLHQDGRTLYPGTGSVQEYGGPGALARTLNIPLPPGTNDEGYLYVMDTVLRPVLDSFKPDIIINSAGQDNHYTDPITSMALSAQGYAQLTKKLNPHLAVLEGGYSVRGALPYVNLGLCLALAGMDFSHIAEPDYDPARYTLSTRHKDHIKQVCDEVLGLWHKPPAKPYEGGAVSDRHGSWWRTEREVYYDTDGILAQEQQDIALCEHCPGLTRIVTSTRRNGKDICLLAPRGLCEHCEARLEAITHEHRQDPRPVRQLREA